ncbi:GGDEF domain-containing protein [Micromonospora sp. C51]|uniref:GGDEF domain-containing protein n=1 Tax=Micromonospora sp. C51 TaxID=2824879 RepID=UPI001B362261|nr:GGDEF domain-containing protein [Micromonospora sp. C51]MBQ1052477.1 GGDEF domain-containing protein [Micromonospora sp. C51]
MLDFQTALLGSTTACCLVLLAYVRHLRAAHAIARHEAHHDPLTGLPNRRALLAHLDGLLADRNRPVSVALLDLNRFKDINDEHGHAAGDLVLRRVAESLTGLDLPNAYVGRMSGDEFLIVIDGERDIARASAHAAARALDELELTIRWQTVGCHASVGLAVADHNDHTATDLLRDADTAMYTAKQRGGGVCEFHPGLITIITRSGNHRRRYR